MENTTAPSKSYLQFGLFYGLIMILSFVIIYALGIDPIENPMIGTVSSIFNYFFFPILFIFLGCNLFKKNNNGYISFVECLKVGVSIAFIGALVFAIFTVVFNLIFPEYMEEILGQTKQIMLKQNPNLTSEQLEMGVSMTKKFSNPLFSVPITIVMFSFLGLLYSLVVGLIVKKDNPQSF